MKSLTWSLDKAPAFSNAKFLVIGLPPCLHQNASIFHQSAYPPAYGNAGVIQANGLPDYHEQIQGDTKESWYAPPKVLENQKVHPGNEVNVARDPDHQFHRDNSARHSLQHAFGIVLSPRKEYEREDVDSKVYVMQGEGGDTIGNSKSEVTTAVDSANGRDVDLEQGLMRPRRSSSRSSRSSGRIL